MSLNTRESTWWEPGGPFAVKDTLPESGRPLGFGSRLLDGYVAQVDWPGASFWRELSAANPDALVVLSTRDADDWYRSASNTIFNVFEIPPPGLEAWFGDTVPKMFRERFCDDLGNPTAMIDAFERHNAQVRAGVPANQLLEWTPSEGWEPICERLGFEFIDRSRVFVDELSS